MSHSNTCGRQNERQMGYFSRCPILGPSSRNSEVSTKAGQLQGAIEEEPLRELMAYLDNEGLIVP